MPFFEEYTLKINNMIKTGDLEYFELLELQDYLKAHRLDKLGLENIDRLRSEIEIKIEEIHSAVVDIKTGKEKIPCGYEDIDGDEGELNEKKMRYEVKEEGKILRVWDNQDKLWITKELPSMAIANEIADDFNKMENKDFRPIGLPNFEGINKRSCK